ncbi:MAG: hypothetical protein J6K36_02725 [Bacilli bacterium]|nr:hypothetical protein [Bacilli bacterium]
MLQVSRANNLRIPKTLENVGGELNSVEDKVAVKQALATANDEKYNKAKIREEVERDKELEQVSKIPYNSNDLMVVTVVKKLGAYIIAITEKSPAKFRGVFVNRMQNICLETLELLLRANFVRLESEEKKKEREEYQKEAIIKLKMLGYISMIAENANCILSRQYKQISLQIGEAINLIAAWKKSDDDRWRKRN